MRIENKKILALLDAKDRIRYYHWCADLSLAGEDYKVSEILFFVKDENDPLSDFIQVKKYDDRFLLIGVYTEDQTLVSECMEYTDGIKNDYEEIELRTPFSSVLEHENIRKRFSLETPSSPANPVYYIHSSAELAQLPPNASVSVSLLTEADKEEIARDVAQGKLDAESMGVEESVFQAWTCFKDVKWYLLRVDGEIAGYLRAECGYENIYDIGWLYVEPRFRGKGYAASLVMYFSHDMFAHGAVPHYGYAISESSARVAEKCGYKCEKTGLICRSLKVK